MCQDMINIYSMTMVSLNTHYFFLNIIYCLLNVWHNLIVSLYQYHAIRSNCEELKIEN